MIGSVGYNELVEMICETKKQLILCVPGLHTEVMKAILARKEEIDTIYLIVDVSESSVRNGYGDIESIDALMKNGIPVLTVPNNRVAFIITDAQAYFLFLESRINSDNEGLINAVEMDPLMKVRLIAYFFPPKPSNGNATFDCDISAAMKQMHDEYASNLDVDPAVEAIPPDQKEFENTKEQLKKNPPVHPDLQRRIKTYTGQIQFVEFHFEGMNFQAAKVTIPPNALPFKDETIKKRLEARMKMFENVDGNKNFADLHTLKKKIYELRREYLTPITSRDKSIIRIDRKEEFTKKIENLKTELAKANTSLEIWLENEILDGREKIKQELLTFLKANPPEEYEKYKSNHDLCVRKMAITADDIVASIKFPNSTDLCSKMELKVNYYDLTWADFNNNEFLKELAQKKVFEEGAVDQIVQMHDAFEAQKDENMMVPDLFNAP